MESGQKSDRKEKKKKGAGWGGEEKGKKVKKECAKLFVDLE